MQYQELPDGLDEMPPGPKLSVLLASLDAADFNGWQLVELLAAQSRQVSYEQSRMLAIARELAFTPRGGPMQPPLRRLDPDPFTGTEIGFALALTEYSAAGLAELAVCVTDRLPALGRALAAGTIDLPKVRVMNAELGDAEDEHARTVIDALLPEAGRLTTSQIRIRLRRLLLTLEPDAVRKRHERALESRWVDHLEYANGTSQICGGYLPKDKAAAAYQYLEAIAAATKAAGDTRELRQIRADVFVDLLAGVDPALAGAVIPAPRKGVVNLQIGLTTLAGLNQDPGELVGFGPVLADIARQTAAQLAATARWRFTARDDDGAAVAEGALGRDSQRHLLGNVFTSNASGQAPTDGPPDARPPGPKHSDDRADADEGRVPSGREYSDDAADPGDGREPAGWSTSAYRPTATQKAFVQARDNTCRAPGCTRPAQRCDLDHIQDRALDGETSIANLCAACRRHHRAKHIGGFQVRRGSLGIDWTTPRGHRYTVIGDHAPPPSPTDLLLVAYAQGYPTANRLRR
jgi:Domain of unknown function (DUF222)